MADVFTREKRSLVMSRIRSRGNKDTELALERIFRRNGITGWRRQLPLYGKPDFAFRRARLAVFIDGCFWHGCPEHGRQPNSNQQYWQAKLARNQARDRKVNSELAARGWRVIRVWEHELAEPEQVLRQISKAISVVPLALSGTIQSNATR